MCDALAVQGKPMNSIGAGDMCTRSMENTTRAMPGGMLNNLKNAKVSNVQVNGDTADLSTATITPPEAQGVLNVYQTAQKIDGKWYVSAPMA
ncbi:hypothetical protein CGZ97_20705 [Enemella evansiae]|nr:hypothetical protein CGZ97_20705 [Enemella evansiae]OYO18470.1 hypothetical protein BI335_07250 [Enemella evansiae]